MKKAMKIRFERIRRKGERWWKWDTKKYLRKKDPLLSPSISACADPAVAQHHASFLLVSWATLMLGIENHKVDL